VFTGQIGRHTPEHAKHVADANVFPTLVEIAGNPDCSQDLRNKSSKALKNILQKCVHLPALEALLSAAPADTLQHVVAQFAKVLPNDAKARKLFVTSGGLKKVQEIKASAPPSVPGLWCGVVWCGAVWCVVFSSHILVL
jgi:hypothetical protein